MSPMHSSSNHLLNNWKEFDPNNEGLHLDAITILLKNLDVALTKREIKSAFKNAGITDTIITFDSFVNFYTSVKMRAEVTEIFASINNGSDLTFPVFQKFLVNTQKVDESSAQSFFEKYSADELMDLTHFSAFLLSSKNSIFRKDKLEDDMNLPLNNYYINSSHNTYLLENQLTGTSSVEAYIRAFQRGCKCVEVDCWDGSNGPLVYHGRTLYFLLI